MKCQYFFAWALTTISLVSGQEIIGELQTWHKITLKYKGTEASETGNPNPFTDYRLEVTFKGPSGQSYKVQGYFAADGNSAETGAQSGNIWQAHLTPDEDGAWKYKTSFRKGTDVALSLDPNAGATESPLDGIEGSFEIKPTNKTGRDHRGKGMLRYVGKHHLQFAGSKEYFLKGGADSPENFLAYEDFDNTPNHSSWRKNWSPHVKDWKEGDPTWKGGKGKGMIGALNYLSGKGMKAFSFLSMNLHGDDKNVFPYITENMADWTRFDCSKLDQWEIVFEHADKMGLHMNFKTLEEENHKKLDDGALGKNRKAYYRELVARFGHHHALNWNLGEEVNYKEHGYTIDQVKSFAKYFRDIDPYDHHIMCTTFPDGHETYRPLLGNNSEMTGVGLQTYWDNVYTATRKWVEESVKAGKPWVVANDEQGHYNDGVKMDALDPGHPGVRRETLWGNLMAGGAGVEYYFGWKTNAVNDLTCQDYRSRDKMFDLTRYALEFFTKNTPFWEMSAKDGIASKGRVLAKPGECYVVQLPGGGSSDVNLSGASGDFKLSWFDPRSGKFEGQEKIIKSGKTINTGNPPKDQSQDWVVLISKNGIVAAVTPSPHKSQLPHVWQSNSPQGLQILHIEGLNQNESASFELTTLNGGVVFTKMMKNQYSITLPSSITSGVYLLHINNNNARIRQKLIVTGGM